MLLRLGLVFVSQASLREYVACLELQHLSEVMGWKLMVSIIAGNCGQPH